MRQGTRVGPGDISIWDRAFYHTANTFTVMNLWGENQVNELKAT